MSSSKDEKTHLAKLAGMPCVLCGAHGVHVHHIREGHGLSQRASHFLAVPLCPDCHQGPEGVHGSRALLRVRKLEELDLLGMTIAALMRA